MAATVDVEGRGRQVHTAGNPALAGAQGVVELVQAIDPDRRLPDLLLQRGLLLRAQSRDPRVRGWPPAMVPLVVQHQDRPSPRQVFEHPLGEDLARLRPLVDHRPGLVTLLVLGLRREAVPVGHQHPPGLEQRPVLHRHQVEGGVVVAFRLGAQHLQPLLHGQVRATDQDGARELPAAGIGGAIAEGPGDQHRHDHRLARAGGHLAAQPSQRHGLFLQEPVHRRVHVRADMGHVDAQPRVAFRDGRLRRAVE